MRVANFLTELDSNPNDFTKDEADLIRKVCAAASSLEQHAVTWLTSVKSGFSIQSALDIATGMADSGSQIGSDGRELGAFLQSKVGDV